ncbi:nitrate ABC transporter ATP-binding protein [Ascidiimonas sp. W6]|uniref:ABC transporter ATP-binding protein n=1 Tax=Ascidiimonas meishanensis TaxID=3128903 RepID=UPI0030EC5AF2
MQEFLKVENISKSYPIRGKNGSVTIYENINFTMNKGEFMCVIGHSGCGKSTILNNLAGLDIPSSGSITMLGKEVHAPSLERGVIFQNHSILPWLTVFKNVTMAIKCKFKNMNTDDISNRATHFLKMVGLQDAMYKKPSELSGGMKQRVGIARAFAIEPSLLLMDEPFGALDALTRGKLQEKLVEICDKTKQTTFMITHDIDEAILLSDRILLMSDGPEARIAEIVAVNIPKPRNRATIINHPAYYDIRNYLVDFLVNHSGTINENIKKGTLKEKDLPIDVDPHQLKLQLENN